MTRMRVKAMRALWPQMNRGSPSTARRTEFLDESGGKAFLGVPVPDQNSMQAAYALWPLVRLPPHAWKPDEGGIERFEHVYDCISIRFIKFERRSDYRRFHPTRMRDEEWMHSSMACP